MNHLRRQNSRPQQPFERWTPRTHESPRELARQSEAKRKQAPQSEANVTLEHPGAVSRVGGKGRDESFQVRAKEPLGTDSHWTISKNSSRCRLLTRHNKCFVLLCSIGEQFFVSSFREFVHDGYCLDHGLSGSCTKEMHAVSKLSVWNKIPIWFKNVVCPKTKDAFPKIQAWAYNRYSRLHRSRVLRLA